MIENTLLVTPNLQSGFEGRPINAYGRVFEQVFTQHASTEQAHGSHHRAIRYNIGPLNCIVLFECDAQVDDTVLDITRQPNWSWMAPSKEFGGKALHDSVVQQLRPQDGAERICFDSLKPASVNTPRLKSYVPPFNVIHDGQGTLSSQTAELSANRKNSKTVQMWFGRTPVSTLAHSQYFPTHHVSRL